MTELVKSPVVFNEAEHTYFLGDKQLSGITSIIKKLIFPDMYANVSQAVLDKAAANGSRVHRIIEMWIHGVITDEDKEEMKPFFEEWSKQHWDGWESEYLVSDNETVASCIDLVVEEQQSGSIFLCDIKTTSVLHLDYLSWQLSIYAYLFEHQNPELKVHGLKAIHIRKGECHILDVPRLKDELVIDLLDTYRSGADFFINPLNEVPKELDELLVKYVENESLLQTIKKVADEYEEKKKKYQDAIANALKEKNLSKIETDVAKVTVGKDSERVAFDFKSFEESETYKDNPDMYKQFLKKTISKGRITITPK